MISFGMISLGIGSVMVTLPHFLAGKYTVGENDSIICDSSRKSQDCHNMNSSKNNSVYVCFQNL